MRDIYLLLEDGTVFQGKSFGAEAEALGETVFCTSMTGYIDTLTDPGYYGQIVVQTFPLTGNFGIIQEDLESARPHLSAYVVREYCEQPSNFRCDMNFSAYLKQHNIPGICGIDTRELTKRIRHNGVMNALVTFQNPQGDNGKIAELKQYLRKNPVSHVTSTQIREYTPQKTKYKIAVLDLGMKNSLARELVDRDCYAITFPASTTAERIIEFQPDGVVLSNGPGSPLDYMAIAAEVKQLVQKNIPVMGISLGHQLLAAANGIQSQPLKYGHRGANQPVKDLATGKIYITSQNNGYTVVTDSISPQTGKMNYINVNDGTCEGIEYTHIPAFGVSFYPQTCRGPQNTGFLYDRFLAMIDSREGYQCR